MALRLIEIVLKEKDTTKLERFLKQFEAIELDELPLRQQKVLIRILLPQEASAEVLNYLETHYTDKNTSRVMVMPVQATLPEIEHLESQSEKPKKSKKKAIPARVAVDELYEDIKGTAICSNFYIAMVILSTIVTVAGLHNDNVIFVIGGMLIAPMLAPIIALSLSITMNDFLLFQRSIWTGIFGVLIALTISIIAGILVDVDPTLPEISSRVVMKKGDILVAFASGAAGALAFTSGVSSALIGVMVAVSLLPPLVTAGLLLGAGFPTFADSAFILFLLNFIAVNCSGIVVFLIQGIRPKRSEKETEKNKIIRLTVLSVWLVFIMLSFIFLRLHIFFTAKV